MRTSKRCTAEQFEQVTRRREFTAPRLQAARRVLVDGVTTATAVEETGVTVASVRQMVQLIFREVALLFKSADPGPRVVRPGYVVLTIEIPVLASAGLIAGTTAAGGVVLEEMHYDAE